MVEAFLTRPTTDRVLEAFVKSAGGICHQPLDSRETDKIVSKKWPTFEEEKLKDADTYTIDPDDFDGDGEIDINPDKN